MAVYELDIYAKTLYGAPGFISYQADNMVAAQVEYGALEVAWATPMQTAESQILSGIKAWSLLRLVRNSYGVPDTEDDGWVILEAAAGQGAGAGLPVNTYLDDTCVPGQVYYYAVFVASAPDDYSASFTYQPGDIVSYLGQVWRCLALDTEGSAPNPSNPKWELTSVTSEWFRAGGCVGLAVRDQSHRKILYDAIPRPYKVDVVEATASYIPINDQLSRFCQVFGYFFDVMKNEHVAMRRMMDVLRCSDKQITLMAQQMGILDRMPSMPQLRRTYVRDFARIQRNRGSITSTRDLVKATTGWDSEVITGYNRMGDLDDARFASPQYPVWQRDSVYYRTASADRFSDKVMWNGDTYAAAPGASPIRYSAFTSFGIPPPVKTGNGTIVYDPDLVADPLEGFVALTGAAVGDTITWSFAAQTAGTYKVLFVGVGDPLGGKVSCLVDGKATSLTKAKPLDLYSESRQLMPMVDLGTYTFDTNYKDFKLTLEEKNALVTTGTASITNCYFLLSDTTRQNLNRQPDLNPAYWTKVLPNDFVFRDWVTERNLLTGGFASWNYSTNQGDIVNPQDSQTWWIWPAAAQTTSAVPADWPGPTNSLAYAYNGSQTFPGQVDIRLAGKINAVDWLSTNTYYAGNAVLDSIGSTKRVYRARTQSVAKRPRENLVQWEETSLADPAAVGSPNPEPYLVQTQCVPLEWTPYWSPNKRYVKGDKVAWGGQLYEAARESFAVFPDGAQGDNLWWRWCGMDNPQYTFSLYHNRNATGAAQDVRLNVSWYDVYGKFIAQGYYGGAQLIALDRNERDGSLWPTAPNPGTAPVPGGFPYPAGVTGGRFPWTKTFGQWAVAQGVAYPTTWDDTTPAARRAGRMLWMKREWLNPPTEQEGEDIYVTFRSAPEEANAEQGIAFRIGGNASNVQYFLASRTRLTYNEIVLDAANKVTQATITPVAGASWTGFSDGTRMRVRVRYTTDEPAAEPSIEVYRLSKSTQWISIWKTTAAENRNNGFYGYGFLERSTA